MHTFKTAAMT